MIILTYDPVHKLTLISFLALFIAPSYARCRQGIPGDSISIGYISKVNLENQFVRMGLGRDICDSAIAYKEFFPDDTLCACRIPLYPPLRFDLAATGGSLCTTDRFAGLLDFTTRMYELIPDQDEPTIDTSVYAANDYEHLFDSLVVGRWGFDCTGNADICRRFIAHSDCGHYITKVGILYGDSGQAVSHTVTLVYFKVKSKEYGITIDSYVGKLGPVLSGRKNCIATINEMKSALAANSTSSFEIKSIPEANLLRKRHIMNDPIPCNYAPMATNIYCHTPPGSQFKIERLAYCELHYVWYILHKMDIELYKKNLLQLLVANSPY
jgi:hypothetical protein